MDGGIVGLSGSIGRPSRTRVLVEAAVHRAAMRYGRRPSVIDPPDLSPSLGSAARLSDLDAGARSAVESIVTADALALGSPVYKGRHGGLVKHLLDLLDPSALVGKPVLLVANGGGL